MVNDDFSGGGKRKDFINYLSSGNYFNKDLFDSSIFNTGAFFFFFLKKIKLFSKKVKNAIMADIKRLCHKAKTTNTFRAVFSRTIGQSYLLTIHNLSKKSCFLFSSFFQRIFKSDVIILCLLFVDFFLQQSR